MGDTTVGDNSSSDPRLLDDVSRLVEQAKELQDSAASLISRTSRDEDSLRQRANSLNSALHALLSSVKKSNLDSKRSEKLEEELFRARYILSEGDAAAFLPSKSHGFAIALFLVSFAPNILCVLRSAFEDVQFLLLIGPVNLDFLAGRFLRMFLGPINVRANRKDVQLKVKEEYNSFRDRTAYLFLLFPLLLIISRSWIWNGCLPALPVQLYQAWLLYLYTGLALRENILRVNGSDIRPWWIYHHYFALAMALISLTWEIEREPDCAQKQKGVLLFLKWAIMQGIAMLLQNRYQRQRLYTRIALGKAGRMDVVWGETAGVEGQLWLLCPILFILQGFEAYVGLLLLKTALVGVTSEWQVVTCGILLIIMAVGNFANTVQTLVSKSRVKAKMKKGKSRQELDQGSVKNQ